MTSFYPAPGTITVFDAANMVRAVYMIVPLEKKPWRPPVRPG